MTTVCHLGSEGAAVKETQLLLHRNRFGRHFLGRKNPANGRYGPETAAAVKRAKFVLGYPKKRIDARAGGEFRAYLKDTRLPRSYALRRAARLAREALLGRQRRALSIARSQLGYVEGSDNSTKFGKWYGMDHVAWCAEFQSWCDEQAGIFFKYAYCPYVVADARAKRNGLRVVKPRPGDHVLFDWDGDGLADHIGMVEKVNRDGSIGTIEGNTSPADWSNGGMVMRRERYRAQIICFVRATGTVTR